MSDIITQEQIKLKAEGQAFLRNGRFRKARDIFKLLHKTAPIEALPLLIEANVGLASEMNSKGMVKEANQLFAYIKTLSPSAQKSPTEKNIPVGSSDPWSNLAELAAYRLTFVQDSESLTRVADDIILGTPSADLATDPDAKAILSAWEIGYGSESSALALEKLRTVPRSSIFSHWIFFFKGMVALDLGDKTKAAELFSRVPQHSALRTSVAALLTICGKSPDASPSAATVHALCAWTGEPKFAAPLLRSDALWRDRKHTKSLSLLANEMPNFYRYGATHLAADLTYFFVHAANHDPSAKVDSEFRSKIISLIHSHQQSKLHSSLARAFLSVTLESCGFCAHGHYDECCEQIKTLVQLENLSKPMVSRIHCGLANSYMQLALEDRRDQCSGPCALQAINDAIEQDPHHFPAWLLKCDLLSHGKNRSQYHRFLDDLTKQFPTEKEVLIRNGICCAERESYTKALRNFESAAKLDAVDPRINAGLLSARIGIAEVNYKKKKKVPVDWDAIESLATATKQCRTSSLWRIRAKRIALEIGFSKTNEHLPQLIADTLPLAPNAFQLYIACCFYYLSHDTNAYASLLEKYFSPIPSAASIEDFLFVLEEYHNTADKGALGFYELGEIFRLNSQVLTSLFSVRANLTKVLHKILCTRDCPMGILSDFIQDLYKRDPKDLLILIIHNSWPFVWRKDSDRESPKQFWQRVRESKDPDVQLIFASMVQNVTNPPVSNDKNWLDLEIVHDQDDEFDGLDGSNLDEILKNIGAPKLTKILESIISESGGLPQIPDSKPIPMKPSGSKKNAKSYDPNIGDLFS